MRMRVRPQPQVNLKRKMRGIEAINEGLKQACRELRADNERLAEALKQAEAELHSLHSQYGDRQNADRHSPALAMVTALGISQFSDA